MVHTSAILSRDGDGTFVSNAKFSPITERMVIDSDGDRIQQGGFSRIAAARDDGYALFDAHSSHTVDLDLIIGCGLKWDGIRHGQVGSRGAGEYTAVGNKGAIIAFLQPGTDGGLLFGKRQGLVQTYKVELGNKAIYSIGQISAEHLDCLADLTARELNLEFNAQAHSGWPFFIRRQQVHGRSRSVLIVALGLEREIGGITR